MQGLDTNRALNAELVVKRIIARAANREVKLTREQILREMAFSDDEDTSVWSSMVDRLLQNGCPGEEGCP